MIRTVSEGSPKSPMSFARGDEVPPILRQQRRATCGIFRILCKASFATLSEWIADVNNDEPFERSRSVSSYSRSEL
jgi:hypothetical protein